MFIFSRITFQLLKLNMINVAKTLYLGYLLVHNCFYLNLAVQIGYYSFSENCLIV